MIPSNICSPQDWTNCELASSLPSAVCLPDGHVLLPPTPSMLDTMTGPPSKGHSMRTDLQLISPATPLPPSRAVPQPADSSLGHYHICQGDLKRVGLEKYLPTMKLGTSYGMQRMSECWSCREVPYRQV